MQDTQVVVETRKLLGEAKSWWLLTWTREENKARIRKATDDTRDMLNAQVREAQKHWPEEVRRAYAAFSSGGDPGPVDGNARQAARAVAEAESEFNRITAQARQTFAEAEREMNAGKARIGAQQAIEAIDKHEALVAAARAAASQR